MENMEMWNNIIHKLNKAREGDGNVVFTTDELIAIINSLEWNEL